MCISVEYLLNELYTQGRLENAEEYSKSDIIKKISTLKYYKGKADEIFTVFRKSAKAGSIGQIRVVTKGAKRGTTYTLYGMRSNDIKKRS